MRPDAHWLQRAQAAATQRFSADTTTIDLLPPHGSLRRYARVKHPSGSSMLMLLPDPTDLPPDAGTAHPEIVADEPFIAVAQWLEDANVHAPRVESFDQQLRVLWISDLGEETFFAAVDKEKSSRLLLYNAALDLLQQFQNASAHPSRPAIVTQRQLDADLLRWELEHYVDWRFERKLGLKLHNDERQQLDSAFTWIVDELAKLPTLSVHRDFQSYNIMRLRNGSLALLDFQDALQGPLPYDAVALLRDSYIELGDEELDLLLERWAQRTHESISAHPQSVEALKRSFHLQTIQRKLKDTGRFELFDLQKGQPEYLKFQPTNMRYVRHAIERLSDVPELQGLHHVLRAREPLYR